MSIQGLLRKKELSFFFGFLIILAVLFLPTMFARATSIGTNVAVTGTLTVTDTSEFTGAATFNGAATVAGVATFNGNVTVGNSATADTLTVTARLAEDLDPNANNTIDLGSFGLAYNNLFVSSTAYFGGAAGDQFIAGTSTALIVKEGGKVGISSSTPSAKLSIGTFNTSSTLDVPQLCFRTTVDIGGVDSEVYYWPCVGDACHTAGMASAGWATSTASCF